jgi:hypothetical protein
MASAMTQDAETFIEDVIVLALGGLSQKIQASSSFEDWFEERVTIEMIEDDQFQKSAILVKTPAVLQEFHATPTEPLALPTGSAFLQLARLDYALEASVYLMFDARTNDAQKLAQLAANKIRDLLQDPDHYSMMDDALCFAIRRLTLIGAVT